MTEHNFATMRSAMVDSQLRTIGVTNPDIVAALSSIPRERFVPETHRALAYAEWRIPLANGRELNSPSTTGRLLMEAGLSGKDNVLLIGAGTGYAAAVLSKLAAKVTALECDASLAEGARLQLVEYRNVELVSGPLVAGVASSAPYDTIIIDGAIAGVPHILIDQIKEGGLLITGVQAGSIVHLSKGVKIAGSMRLTPFAEMDCVELPGFEVRQGFVF